MIDAYIAYIRDVRRYSPRTQTLYREALEDFASFACLSGEEEISAHLIPSRIREYEARLVRLGRKPRTVHLHMSALSGYCNFLIRQGVLKSNPVRGIKRPKMEKRLPEYYLQKSMDEYLSATAHAAGEDELQILLHTDPKDPLAQTLFKRRLHRLIIVILYETGIRRAELIGLRKDGVDAARQSLRVLGKGDKMREIPLIPSLVQEISLYLHAASWMFEDSQAQALLLLTEKGRPLYPGYVDKVVKSELDGYGITGRKSPHVLRHTLATALLESGAGLNAIKEMLGHSSLAATEVYTHNSIQRLKAQYINAHPRAKNEESHD